MLLDRGELKDWFGSTEIWIEATIAALGLYLFIVHTTTAGDRSFLNRELLKDPNCVCGTLLMFLIGVPSPDDTNTNAPLLSDAEPVTSPEALRPAVTL